MRTTPIFHLCNICFGLTQQWRILSKSPGQFNLTAAQGDILVSRGRSRTSASSSHTNSNRYVWLMISKASSNTPSSLNLSKQELRRRRWKLEREPKKRLTNCHLSVTTGVASPRRRPSFTSPSCCFNVSTRRRNVFT